MKLPPTMEHYELVTLEKYWHLDPAVQGYVVGLQFALLGSELSEEANPYPMGTSDFELWARGYIIALGREDV